VWAAQYWGPTLGDPPIDAERLDGAVDTGYGSKYGAGILVGDDVDVGEVLIHDGAWGGFQTIFAVAPEHRIAVAATCTSPGSPQLITFPLAFRLLAAWSGHY
jgi:hypothetical protein